MVSIGVVDDGSLCHSCRGWRWCYGVSTRSFVSVSQDLVTLSRAVTLVSGLAEMHAAQLVGDTAGDKEAVNLFGKLCYFRGAQRFSSLAPVPLGP